MATVELLSTKMIMEYVHPTTRKKNRFSFPYIKNEITEDQLILLAASLRPLRNTPLTNLYKTETVEIF